MSQNRPKILVNASTLVVGGGVQVGVSFIDFLFSSKKVEEADFIFCVSRQILDNLSPNIQSDGRVIVIDVSPARLWKGKSSRDKLLELEKGFKADVVYSIGSPSYVLFKQKQILRHTDPWVTHPSALAYKSMPLFDRWYLKLLRLYKIFWLKRSYWYETQSEVAKKGLFKYAKIREDRVKVIPNTFSHIFESTIQNAGLGSKDANFNILTLSAPYWHKNLILIPAILEELRRNYGKFSYKFIVTLPDDSSLVVKKFWSLAKYYNVLDGIVNQGVVKLEECAGLYGRSSLLFLPTLLETFSVTYLEAMKVGIPIVTTDLEFSREICGEAALYFTPKDPRSAATQIYKACTDISVRNYLGDLGSKRLQFYPTPDVKYQKVLDYIYEINSIKDRDFL